MRAPGFAELVGAAAKRPELRQLLRSQARNGFALADAPGCESALKSDPGRFRHTALKFRTKSRQGWGPYRRRSGPHLRAQIARYFNSLWSIWRGVPLQC